MEVELFDQNEHRNIFLNPIWQCDVLGFYKVEDHLLKVNLTCESKSHHPMRQSKFTPHSGLRNLNTKQKSPHLGLLISALPSPSRRANRKKITQPNDPS